MEQELRYERKFYVTAMQFPDLLRTIHLHSAMFSEIFHQRQINNIYFDSLGFESYYDNVDGATYRIKARIRWYGDTFGTANKPVLEFKIKKGLLGYKRSFKLADFLINNSISRESLLENMLANVNDEKLRNYLSHLHPVLLNVYTRKYFLTADKSIRLTIDKGMHYYSILNEENGFLSSVKDEVGMVVEMKYDKETEVYANQVSSEFPFLMTKNSKYLQGVIRVLGLEL